ncbi:MAG TPA: alkaline phosphatase D family protein [Polyangiaceae bacterium]|nr:alkaline phosphatase D family protein [Polyangiaceae bacterium]
MTLTRRRFLGGLGPATLAPLWSGCGADADRTQVTPPPGWQASDGVPAWPAPAAAEAPFLHGVASGDPLEDAVILWTRVTPPEADTGEELEAIDVEWRIALDSEQHQLVQQGSARAQASDDFTLHVDVSGLSPGTTYYYQFRALGQPSRRGRTKTLPAGDVERVRLAITSCANYPSGFFHAYAQLARTDLDLVLHLGDYLYEYGNGTLGDGTPIGRMPDPPGEIVTLDDYRRRHAQYKTDPDLQELHRQQPWLVIWDDHEIADNAYRDGALNHQAPGEGVYLERRESALRAYREWMPLRAAADPDQIYRSFACGTLLDLLLLDTRIIGRDQQANDCDVERLNASGRQLLGSAQEAWLTSSLEASQARGTRWRFIGQQVIFAPLARSMRGCVSSSDEWDGYAASRERVFDALERGGIDNVVVLTGDAHSAWGIDVPRDPFDPAAYDPVSGRGSQLVELVTPAVSSPPAAAAASTILRTHPHVKFVNQTQQGYVVIDVTREVTRAEWYFLSTVRERSFAVEFGAAYEIRAGEPHLVPAGDPLAPREAPAPA